MDRRDTRADGRRTRSLTEIALRCLIVAIIAAWPAGSMAQEEAPWNAALPAGTYLLDPSHALLTARMSFLGISRFTTRFTRLNGSFVHHPNQPGAERVIIEVDPRSMHNADTIYGKRMLAAFETDRFPTITFVSHELRVADGRQTLVGELTMHGVTKPVSLEVRLRGVEASGGAPRAAFSGTAAVRRSDFGITTMRGVVGNRVRLRFDVEFVRRSGPSTSPPSLARHMQAGPRPARAGGL